MHSPVIYISMHGVYTLSKRACLDERDLDQLVHILSNTCIIMFYIIQKTRYSTFFNMIALSLTKLNNYIDKRHAHQVYKDKIHISTHDIRSTNVLEDIYSICHGSTKINCPA